MIVLLFGESFDKMTYAGLQMYSEDPIPVFPVNAPADVPDFFGKEIVIMGAKENPKLVGQIEECGDVIMKYM